MRFAVASIVAFALSACATMPADAGGRQLRSISYAAGPCFGACPVFRVTVNSDGTGIFEGGRYAAVTGERRFTITPAQFRAFAARLAPYRPAAGERHYAGETCRRMATDQDSVEIVWRGAGEQRLNVYYGCDMETNRAMFERLRSAPTLLPIGDFIRPRR
jgi:hypothetical protein